MKPVRATSGVLQQFKKTISKGLKKTPKEAPLGEKVFGLATKGTALGLGGYGAYRVHKAIKSPKSGRNYQTFLRNNILSGNISPDEVPANDLERVRKLGLK